MKYKTVTRPALKLFFFFLFPLNVLLTSGQVSLCWLARVFFSFLFFRGMQTTGKTKYPNSWVLFVQVTWLFSFHPLKSFWPLFLQEKKNTFQSKPTVQELVFLKKTFVIPRRNCGWHGATDGSVSVRGPGRWIDSNRGYPGRMRGPTVQTAPATRREHGGGCRQINGCQPFET